MHGTIPVVCLGAGWVTSHRHIPALKRDPRVRVLGVVDPHPERGQAVARRHGLDHWGTSVEEAWVARAACATVGTPPATHAEVVATLLDKGIHVLCEKPLATTVADAERLVTCAAHRQRFLAVVHNFQFATAMKRAYCLIDAGALGELVAIYAVQLSNQSRRLPEWYPSLQGGLFYDEAPHLVYLLRSLLGDLRVSHVVSRIDRSSFPPHIEQIASVFEHPTVWAQLVMNFRSPLSEWQVIIVGKRRLMAVDIFRDVSVVLRNDEDHAPWRILRTSGRATGEHLAGVLRSGFNHLSGRLLYGNQEVVRRFLDTVSGQDGLNGISGADGVAVVKTLHELLRETGI